MFFFQYHTLSNPSIILVIILVIRVAKGIILKGKKTCYIFYLMPLKVFLNNVWNITLRKLLSIVHPLLSLIHDTRFFMVDFSHNNSFVHNTKKVAFRM